MSDSIPFLGALPAIDLAAYNPLKEENTTEWAAWNTSVKTVGRIALANPLLTALGVPQLSMVGGGLTNFFKGGVQSIKKEEGYKIALTKAGFEATIFALSLVPFYGNFVDLFYFGREIYKNGWTLDASIYLGGAILGFATSGFQFGRLVRITPQTIAEVNVKIPLLKLARDVKEARLKGIVVTNEEVTTYIKRILQNIKPAVEETGEEFVKRIVDQTHYWINSSRYKPWRLNYLCNREILRQQSRRTKSWLEYGSWALKPRQLFTAINPLAPQICLDLWKRCFYLNQPIKLTRHGVAKMANHARNVQDFPITEKRYKRYAQSCKPFLDEIAEDLKRTFPDSQFKIDPNAKNIKTWDSLLNRFNNGNAAYDVCRTRVITHSLPKTYKSPNNVTAHISRYLMRKYGAIPTHTLAKPVHLDPIRPYRANHFIIPFEGGVVEIQLMGREMRRWYHKDHYYYKNCISPPSNHIKYGIRAFERDGGYPFHQNP